MSATETPAIARLAGGPIPYTLRRSSRSRGLRVVIHPDRGVVVTVPASTRRGWARPERHVDGFLAEREPWLRRHLARHEHDRAMLTARGGLTDGAIVRYRGELHRLRVRPAPPGRRRSTVERTGAADADELVIELASRDRRPVGRVLREWLRERAAETIEREIDRYAVALAVTPAAVALRDPRTRWGSASREGRLMFSWRLVLAPPGALEAVVVHELVHLRVFGHGPAFWAIVASRVPDHVRWRRWLREHAHEVHCAVADTPMVERP